jgi:hypothetical protein
VQLHPAAPAFGHVGLDLLVLDTFHRIEGKRRQEVARFLMPDHASTP